MITIDDQITTRGRPGLRILFLNHNIAWRGGTFYRAFDVGRELARRGHDVTLITVSATRRFGFGRYQKEGVNLVESPDWFWGAGRTGWDPWDTVNRALEVRREAWDIIHAWDTRPAVVLPALTAAKAARQSGGRLVMDWCDWWGRGGTQAERTTWWLRLAGPLETFFEERFREDADGTTVISSPLRQRAISLGVDPNRILFLPQGCEARTAAAEDRRAARAELGLPSAAQLLVFVGALNASDAELLFATVRLLLSQRADLYFAIIGKHRSRIPSDLAGHSRFKETGFVTQRTLDSYVDACDALLAPLADTLANRARWPSKVNNFLAAGRATITTSVGDLPEFLRIKGAGAVVPCDPSSVANAAQRVLDEDEVRRSIELNAHKLAKEELSWTRIVDTLVEFYVTLLNEPCS